MNELQTLIKVSKDDDWFRGHYEELRKNYENEFVAIDDGEVIAHNSNVEALIGNLKDKGKDPALLLIKAVRKKGSIIIL